MEKYKQALHPGTPVRSTENVYVIEKVLGQGSFGITYLASTYMKGNRGKARVLVALKEFFAEDLDIRCGDGAVASRTMDGIAHKYAKAFQRESENLSKIINRDFNCTLLEYLFNSKKKNGETVSAEDISAVEEQIVEFINGMIHESKDELKEA